MTRTQVYRTLMRCSEGNCNGCLLEHADGCVKLLVEKAAAVIRADNKVIGATKASKMNLEV